MSNNYTSLNNLAFAATNKFYLELLNEKNQDGYWLNIFNFCECIKNEKDYKYPLIINKKYNEFPIFENCSFQYKFNNTIEIVEWDNIKIKNIIHYKYVIKYNKKNNLYIDEDVYNFLDENMIENILN